MPAGRMPQPEETLALGVRSRDRPQQAEKTVQRRHNLLSGGVQIFVGRRAAGDQDDRDAGPGRGLDVENHVADIDGLVRAGTQMGGQDLGRTAAVAVDPGGGLRVQQAEPYALEFEPSSTGLLIIDMQRDFLEPGGFGALRGALLGLRKRQQIV